MNAERKALDRAEAAEVRAKDSDMRFADEVKRREAAEARLAEILVKLETGRWQFKNDEDRAFVAAELREFLARAERGKP